MQSTKISNYEFQAFRHSGIQAFRHSGIKPSRLDLKRIVLLFILLKVLALSVYGQQRSVVSETNFQCDIVLDIYDAFYDWHTSTSWGGSGNPKSEAEKFSVGAVCVANKNDTNGNGTPDYQETNITQNLVGRNEIDLMKLVIRPRDPSQNLTGQVDLRLISGNNIKLWTSPVKFPGTQVSLPMSTSADQLPITLYIEALEPSESLREIVFEAEFGGNTDRVSATAVWVDIDEIFFQNQQQIDPELLSKFGCVKTAFEVNGEFFGTGHSSHSGYEKYRAGLIFQWSVKPTNADELIVIDGTRQRHTNNWKVNLDLPNGPDCKFIHEEIKYPFNDPTSISQDNEFPNDDASRINTCLSYIQNGVFLTQDFPGVFINQEFLSGGNFPAYWGYGNDKTNFLEWIRVAPKNNDFNPGYVVLLGSRVSEKISWSFSRYTNKNNEFKLQVDNQSHTLNHIRVNQLPNDHVYYPINYTINQMDHSYELGTYHAAIFNDLGDDKEIILLRINEDSEGHCVVIEEDVDVNNMPADTDYYELPFNNHKIQITETENFDRLFLNWHTFFSSNKLNELNVNHQILNLNH